MLCLQNFASIGPSIKKIKKIAQFLHSAYHASYCIHKLSRSSLTLSPFPPQKEAKVAPRIRYKSTRTHYTRAYVKRKTASAEQENVKLREEVSNLKEGMEKMVAMMEAMMIAQAEARAQAQGQAQAPAMNYQLTSLWFSQSLLLHLLVFRSRLCLLLL